MQNKILTQSLSAFRIVLISSLTIFTLYTVQAWISPTVSAPNGNVGGPLTIATTTQVKTGSLGLTGDFLTGGNISAIGTISATGTIKALGGLIVTGTTTTNGLKVVNGAGVNKILTSDVSGNASWQTPAGSIAAGTVMGTCNGGNSPTYPALSCTSWACGYGYAWACWGISTCDVGWTRRLLGGDPWDNAYIYGCVKN